MLSQEWYREHMPRFKAHFEDKTRDIPKDADILADMRAVKRDKGVAKVPDGVKVAGSDGQPRHGDAAIACALADYAVATMDPVPIEFESTGTRAGFAADAPYRGPDIFGDLQPDTFDDYAGRRDLAGFM